MQRTETFFHETGAARFSGRLQQEGRSSPEEVPSGLEAPTVEGGEAAGEADLEPAGRVRREVQRKIHER